MWLQCSKDQYIRCDKQLCRNLAMRRFSVGTNSMSQMYALTTAPLLLLLLLTYPLAALGRHFLVERFLLLPALPLSTFQLHV